MCSSDLVGRSAESVPTSPSSASSSPNVKTVSPVANGGQVARGQVAAVKDSATSSQGSGNYSDYLRHAPRNPDGTLKAIPERPATNPGVTVRKQGVASADSAASRRDSSDGADSLRKVTRAPDVSPAPSREGAIQAATEGAAHREAALAD